VDLRLLRRQPRQDAAEAQRLLAQRRPHPVVAGGRRVAFVEDEVDDLEHRGQTGGELGSTRHFEGRARLGERPSGAHDALGHRRLRNEERPRDLLDRQAAEQTQRERNPAFGGKHGMTGREHQAQQIVADPVVEGGVGIRRRQLLPQLELASEFLMLEVEQLVPAQPVDRPILRGGHEPGRRIVRDARVRPALERDDERVLRQLLGQADVAQHPREAGNEPRRLDPPDRVDRAMGVGSRHGYQLRHPTPRGRVELLGQRLPYDVTDTLSCAGASAGVPARSSTALSTAAAAAKTPPIAKATW
jgi:hypothetical protein